MPSLGAKEQAMSINAIQFQRSLSLPQFQALLQKKQLPSEKENLEHYPAFHV